MIPMIDEKHWQDEWEKLDMFVSRKDGRKKFFITVPWPYTSGPLHVGHGRTYTIADFIARFKRLMGYNVLFPMGFHESGTPIEAISDKLRKNDQKTVALYRKYIAEYENKDNVEATIEKFFDPQEVADFFADKIIKDFKALGYSIDWTRTFRSVDERYKKMVEWQFRKLDSLGFLTKGSHAVLYSPEDGNAVGEDDIEDGDTNKVSIEEFVTVLFKGKHFYLAASSLRPETIYGITNLWINQKAKYVILKINGKKVVMTREASEKYAYQNRKIEIIGNCKLSEIIEDEYDVPLSGKKVKAYLNDEIDPDHATGVVYSVPGHSVKDYYYLEKLGIATEMDTMIEIGGKNTNVREYLDKYQDLEQANADLYRDEYYSGKVRKGIPEIEGISVKEAREIIKKRLINEDLAFIFLETTRKARTRNGGKVVVSVIDDQWFIDYSNKKWKEETRKHVKDMDFQPDFYKKNMLDIVDWIAERACARRRGLGTELPMDRSWVIESLSDSTIYPAFYTMSPFIRDANQLNDDFFDMIFDASNPNPAESEYKEAAEEFRYWYGVDQRITSSPHMSNHLIFYIMNHVALFNNQYWPKGITISGTVISNGAKISKSKGNGISLLDVVRIYGADLFRMYVAVNSDVPSSLDWNEKDVAVIRNKYEELCSVLDEASTGSRECKGVEYELFLSKFALHHEKFIEKMEKLSVRDAYIEIIYEVLNDLSELRNMGGNPTDATRKISRDWLQMLSCVIPHTCEHFWKKFGFEGYVSKSILSDSRVNADELNLIREWKYCQGIIADVRSIEKVTKIKARKVEIIMADRIMYEDAEKILHNDYNVKRKGAIQAIKKMQNKLSLELDEAGALTRFQKIVERITGWSISTRVFIETDNKMPLPGRPVINIEGDRNDND